MGRRLPQVQQPVIFGLTLTSMAISYIASGGAQTNTITIPTGYVAGDLLVMFAFRDGNTTAPTIPAGWTQVGLNTGTLTSSATAYKVATSSSETSGTWTNADALICHVYRGQLATGTPIVNSGAQAGTGTSINYSGIVTMTAPGTSWVTLFAGHSSIDTSLETAKSGTVNRSDNVGAVCEVAGHDTNGAVSSFSFGTVPVGGTSGNWITKTIEILASTGKAKVYNGTSFVAKPAKVWNGTAWVAKPVKVWNGTAWVTTSY